MATRRSIVIVAAGVGAAIGLLLIGRPGPSAAQVEGLTTELDVRVRETAAAAQARATTLAALPRLAWAVATDENTMLDLTAEELAFQPQPGEFIEIGQVRRADHAVTSLRRVGSTAVVHLPLADSGMHLIAAGGELHAAAIVSVEPKQRADVLRGAIGVSRRVELGPVAERLAQAGIAARLETTQGSITIGHAPAHARAEAHPLRGDVARSVRLVLLLPARHAPTAGYIVAAIAVLLASLGAAAFLSRRRATPERPDPELPELVSQVYIDLKKDPSRRPRA